jgi:hypothetical protein
MGEEIGDGNGHEYAGTSHEDASGDDPEIIRHSLFFHDLAASHRGCFSFAVNFIKSKPMEAQNDEKIKNVTKMVRLYGSFIFFLYICSRKYTKINQTINQA